MATVNRAARQRRETAQQILEAIPVAVFRVDEKLRKLLPLNAAARQLATTSDADEIAAAVFSSAEKHIDGAGCFTISNGRDQYLLNYSPPGAGGSQDGLVAVSLLQKSVEKVARESNCDDAFHDPLTRLPNRRLFQLRLDQAIERAAHSKYQFAVLFVDLDRFKSVNNRFGHVVGDKMLVAAAQRLLASVRPQDTVARRDGDEFTVLLDNLAHPKAAQRVAERICEQMRAPLLVDGESAFVGASVGIATSSTSTQTAESLIATADAAMYHAKALGGGTFVSLPKTLPR